MMTRRYGSPRTDEERLIEHFGSDWYNHSISELPPRGSRLEQETDIKGPLGLWKFPFLNKLRAKRKPKYSIKDHTVISGSPDYVGYYQIKVDGNSVPWTIEWVYDAKVRHSLYSNGALQNVQEVTVPKYHQSSVRQSTIDWLKDTGFNYIYEQLEPR